LIGRDDGNRLCQIKAITCGNLQIAEADKLLIGIFIPEGIIRQSNQLLAINLFDGRTKLDFNGFEVPGIAFGCALCVLSVNAPVIIDIIASEPG
jgi:hypothetical protein